MEPIRIGVVGLGFGQFHVHTLVNLPEARLVAVADSQRARADDCAARYGVAAYSDGGEMLAGEQLDAVSLCVSPRHREGLITAAAARGVALFVEKPWATDLAHAQHLAALCAQSGATAMVGFSFRFHPAIERLRQLLDEDLGEGWLLNGDYVFGWLPPADHWLWDPGNGNGFFNENSCHLFDAVCHLMGDPVAVSAEAGTFMGSAAEEAAAVTLRFAGGGLAALTCGAIGARAHHDYPRLDLVAERGQARLVGRDHIWERLTWSGRDGDEVRQVTLPPEALGDTRYTRAFRHFFECLREGRAPSATVADGVRSVAVAMAVTEAARSGRRVELAW